MSKRKDDQPHGRFGRSGRTTHHVPDASPADGAHAVPAPTRQLPVAPAEQPTRYRDEPMRSPAEERYAYRDDHYRDDHYQADHYRDDPYRDAPYRRDDRGYAEPPYRREPDYRQPDYRQPDYREPRGHRDDTRYREPDHRDTEYREPRGYRDDIRYREPDYREPDYREPDYRDTVHQGTDYRDRDSHEPRYREPDRRPAGEAYPPAGYPAAPGAPSSGGDPYGPSTYQAATAVEGGASPTVGKAALQLGKATVTGTNKAARTVTRKVISLSEADGAKESGLTALIWNQVLSYGTDAMITVALAGTVFFGASSSAQRGNVLLYLLVTMAPFAVVAPVIGPALDRLQHGRRWTMAGTAVGRAALALVMAMHPTDLLVLYPCALGSLVLSKAYGVLRAAAAPRLVPAGMTLTAANAKLTIFGLGSTIVLGALVGAIIKGTGSYSAGLVVTAVGFAACAVFAFKLPKQVDSAQPAPRHPDEPVRPRRQEKVPPLARIREWAKRGFGAHLVIALQGQCLLRLLSGMLTIYLAFYVESTKHGLAGALELGGVVGAAGAGNFLGTAIGTRLRMAKPEALIVITTVIAFGTLVVAAITFSILTAIVAMLVCSALNALSKIALDSLIQNDVIETLRSSAFGKSETFLQLAWVIGAGLGVALPSTSTGDGTIAFVVATVITGAVAALVVLRMRANSAPAATPRPAGQPGVPRSLD